MARRIVRTAVKVTILSFFLVGVIFFLDSRFRMLPHNIHSTVHTGVHTFFPDHHDDTVITDISYLQCSSANILVSCLMDPTEGWSRVEKDVFLLGSRWVHGYINIQRKKEMNFAPTAGEKVVVDVRVTRKKPEPNEGAGDKDVEWESRPGNIWIKRQGRMIDSAITAVDLLYGPDAVEVRQGWQLKEGTLSVGEQARLTVRRGSPVVAKKPIVMMGKNHKLKIIQVADLHLSTGVGKCREPEPPETAAKCEADPRTLSFLERILDDEKPDIAVLTGDQINGETAPDVQTALFKFAEPFITRKIPFATILGNHDDESPSGWSREQIMNLTASLPYSLSQVGPPMGPMVTDGKGRTKREGGAGNYLVEVVAHNRMEHAALSLYFLDSHSYALNSNVVAYDWIKPYQIDWFKKTAHDLKDAHDKYSYIHLNMAFIHIPLPEYRLENLPMVGEKREPPMSPRHNSGFKDALIDAGVTVLSAGHDHANDYCLLDGLWMCYGGGSGFGGYGGYKGYIRRVRLFEIDAPADRIKTWKRVEWNDNGKVDMQTIVDGGKVVSPV